MKAVPKPITIRVCEQENISSTIDNFFIEAKEHIEKLHETQGSEWEIRSGELAYNSSHVTDDRITYLKYKDTILASVFATRTKFNHIKYTFFRNTEGFEEYTYSNQDQSL